MRRSAFCAIALIAIGASSCSDPMQESRSPSADFGRALAICDELLLPNSMAREAGFDIDAHLAELELALDEAAKQFADPVAQKYLNERLETESDDLAVECIRRLLDRTA